jgi:hypothetical protein
VNRTHFAEHEDGFRIDRCQVARFSGDGANLSCAWCFSVRHSMLAYQQGRRPQPARLGRLPWTTGSPATSGRDSRRATRTHRSRSPPTASSGTARRTCWSRAATATRSRATSSTVQGPAGSRSGKGRSACTQITITGNFIKRSGKLARGGEPRVVADLHGWMPGGHMRGKQPLVGSGRRRRGPTRPATASSTRGLRNCVIRDNVLHDGALKELLLDLGGHGEGVVVGDNPGRLFAAGH